jgi:hypothetical protein
MPPKKSDPKIGADIGAITGILLKMKTRNGRKINLSFAVELEGQDGEDIKDTEQQFKGDNGNKMKHHPIMSKIAKFMIAIKKKCNTV